MEMEVEMETDPPPSPPPLPSSTMEMETETEPEVTEPVADDELDCIFRHCFCRWCRSSPWRIPRVAPGRDYEGVAAEDSAAAAWSLFIGFTSPSDSLLRLRRFRVARSGRVLGRSDDSLDNVLDDVDYGAKGISSLVCVSAAKPSPDARSLSFSLLSKEFDDPRFHAVQLDLDFGAGAGRRMTLPDVPPVPFFPTSAISAAGALWVPCFTTFRGPSHLVMRRRSHGDQSDPWETVATMEATSSPESRWNLISGYAVVGDIILLSLPPPHLFVAFSCSTCTFTPVATTAGSGAKKSDYFPLCGNSVHVKEDDTIYFLHYRAVYAYKLEEQQDGHYQIAPPTLAVDRLCPFESNEGYEFLTHLGDRDMCYCYVWSRPDLGCCNRDDTLHMLITTFRVKGSINRSNHNGAGFQILHSTCRQLHKSQIKPNNFFYLRQEHREFNHETTMPPAKKKKDSAMAPSMLTEFPGSSNVVQSAKILPCCREFLNKMLCLGAIMLEGSAIKIKRTLYIICQVSSRSTVYEISILNGRLPCNGKTHKSHYFLETSACDDANDLMERPPSWEGRPLSLQFVCDGTFIYGVPNKRNEIYKYCLDLGIPYDHYVRRPRGDDFSIKLVLRVGYKIIAICDTLGAVYYWCYGADNWERRNICGIYGPADLETKVNLIGYVVLSDELFMVYDTETSSCFLFDLVKDTWSVVMPYPDPSSVVPGWGRFLCGRSVFAAGFIYTCAYGGLAAYEKIELEDDTHSLGSQILLIIPWRKNWEASTMCLEYVGMDKTSGAIMFCAVQGQGYNGCRRWGARYNHHSVFITTIQVHTARMPNGKLEPVAIHPVDVGTYFVEQDGGPIWTTTCFAVEADVCIGL